MKLRAKSNINIVQKINKCFCYFLTSPFDECMFDVLRKRKKIGKTMPVHRFNVKKNVEARGSKVAFKLVFTQTSTLTSKRNITLAAFLR